MNIHIKFADASSNKIYSKKRLQKRDKTRLKKSPNLALKENFRTSRALKDEFKKRGHFSISHKDDLCMVGFSRKKGFGVDLERLEERDFSKVVDFCFNDDEKELFLKSDEKLKTFYMIYTAKEAIIKANDLGFSNLLDVGYSLHVNAFLDEKKRIFHTFFAYMKKKYIFCVSFKEKRGIIF